MNDQTEQIRLTTKWTKNWMDKFLDILMDRCVDTVIDEWIHSQSIQLLVLVHSYISSSINLLHYKWLDICMDRWMNG